jgi:hypothetical protein
LGLDGAFVLLGAWRATDDEKPDVPRRMERTYEHAAVAITITTMTDVFTFMIGATIPHAAVRIFCLYMSMTSSVNSHLVAPIRRKRWSTHITSHHLHFLKLFVYTFCRFGSVHDVLSNVDPLRFFPGHLRPL